MVMNFRVTCDNLEFLVYGRPIVVEQAAALLTCVLDVHIASFDGVPTIMMAVP